MTKTEKLKTLERWARSINSTNSVIDSLHAVTGMCDGPLIESIWKLQDFATDMAAMVVNDQGEWLEWYRNENAIGAKGHEGGPVGKTRKIESLADLLWVMEAST